MYPVTKKNIQLRYLIEKKVNHTSYEKMAKIFGVGWSTIAKWILEGKFSRMPDKRKCPHCHKSVNDMVMDWLNDGSIQSYFKKQETT